MFNCLSNIIHPIWDVFESRQSDSRALLGHRFLFCFFLHLLDSSLPLDNFTGCGAWGHWYCWWPWWTGGESCQEVSRICCLCKCMDVCALFMKNCFYPFIFHHLCHTWRCSVFSRNIDDSYNYFLIISNLPEEWPEGKVDLQRSVLLLKAS